LTIDDSLMPGQGDQDLLIQRMLDDLYRVMSHSRWKDDRFWPQLRDALLRARPDVRAESLEMAREYTFERCHCQDIGRNEPDMAYARGYGELEVLGI